MKDKILNLRRRGKSYNEICAILGCSKSTVSYHCNGGRNRKPTPRVCLDFNTTIKLAKTCISYRSLVAKLGLPTTPSNNRKLKKFCIDNNIDTNHFLHYAASKGRKGRKQELSVFLTKLTPNSSLKSHRLKLLLYRYGIKKELCEECGLTSEWCGKKLSMHLDHINGDNRDNRLDNLRILCPNCHSQTPTYAGKNIKLKKNNQSLIL